MSKVFPVRVTRTVEYTPEAYIKCCEEFDDEPTQDGFQLFIQEWIEEDFRDNVYSQQTVIVNLSHTEQLHQDFMRDFNELLKRYDAGFDVYDGIPEIYFRGIYKDGQTIRSYSEITLNTYINPN